MNEISQKTTRKPPHQMGLNAHIVKELWCVPFSRIASLCLIFYLIPRSLLYRWCKTINTKFDHTMSTPAPGKTTSMLFTCVLYRSHKGLQLFSKKVWGFWHARTNKLASSVISHNVKLLMVAISRMSAFHAPVTEVIPNISRLASRLHIIKYHLSHYKLLDKLIWVDR